MRLSSKGVSVMGNVIRNSNVKFPIAVPFFKVSTPNILYTYSSFEPGANNGTWIEFVVVNQCSSKLDTRELL